MNAATGRSSVVCKSSCLMDASPVARVDCFAAAIVIAVSFTFAMLSCAAQAQDADEPAKAPETPKRLLDREPFDRITLDAANKGVAIEVLPLGFNGKIPSKKDTPIRLRLLKYRSRLYELQWRAVESIEFHHEMLLKEARRLLDAKEYNEAFEYLSYIYREYGMPFGAEDLIHKFLYENAMKFFQEKKYGESLAILDELFQRNPDYRVERRDVGAAIGQLFDQIMSQTVAQGDFGPARKTLNQIRIRYGDRQAETIKRWQDVLNGMASTKRDEARDHLDNMRYREAIATAKEMMRIWPEVKGGRELTETIVVRYPLVLVGVSQYATVHDSARFEDWAARRTGRLMERRLCEYADRGPEGGRYISPLGSLETSDDNRQLFLALDPARVRSKSSHITGYDIAQRLLSLANPSHKSYLPAWGALVQSVSVDDIYRVRIDFRKPHVLPEALLQTMVQTASVEGRTAADGPYVVGPQRPNENSFMINPRYSFRQPKQPVEIAEKVFVKSDQAVNALKRGEIDVLDRIFPADVPRLRGDDAISVGQYTLPTLHVLIPNFRRPFGNSSTFRRAILYSIDRNAILYEELLGGFPPRGSTVISGPFPPGFGTQDSLAYAYDERIRPRNYEPRLGYSLLRIAEKELEQLEKQKAEAAKKAADNQAGISAAAAVAAELNASPQQPSDATPSTPPTVNTPKIGDLVLGHPANEMGRIASLAIVEQLKQVGLKVSLKELPTEKLTDPDNECDLVFAEIVMCEPAVDAIRLLGPGGFLPETNPYVNLALRRLEAAKDWKSASDALRDLHRIVYDDTTVIPLWQITEHYAYRKWLKGPNPQSVQLYSDVERWELGVRLVEE
ncbi:MAG: hypothetical protein FJ295_11855 [Planctomycetes bacterium]|nr:hypothetical protein [Planctomycetota bacterium]